MTKMTAALKNLWCDFTHGGGKIHRDAQGQINWRCSKCGRWSDNPVSLTNEAAHLAKQIEGADDAG